MSDQQIKYRLNSRKLKVLKDLLGFVPACCEAFGEKGKGSNIPAPTPETKSKPDFYNIKGFYEQ